MRLRLLVLLTPLIFAGCEFGDPNEIAVRTEAALRPYFPSASAVVLPQAETIYGMACVDLGPRLIEQIAPVIAASPEVKKLRKLRALEWVPGNHRYRYFVIGFEKQLVMYDVDSEAVTVRDAGLDYRALYSRRCAVQRPVSALSTASGTH